MAAVPCEKAAKAALRKVQRRCLPHGCDLPWGGSAFGTMRQGEAGKLRTKGRQTPRITAECLGPRTSRGTPPAQNVTRKDEDGRGPPRYITAKAYIDGICVGRRITGKRPDEYRSAGVRMKARKREEQAMSSTNEMPGKPACRDLFEVLRTKTGAPYISDMRFLHREAAIRAAAKEQTDAYSLREWNDALDYFLSHPGCSSTKEAKRVFMRAAQSL